MDFVKTFFVLSFKGLIFSILGGVRHQIKGHYRLRRLLRDNAGSGHSGKAVCGMGAGVRTPGPALFPPHSPIGFYFFWESVF